MRQKEARISSTSTGTSSCEDESLDTTDVPLDADFVIPLHFNDLAKSSSPDVATPMRIRPCNVAQAEQLAKKCTSSAWWEVGNENFTVMYSLIYRFEDLNDDEQRAVIEAVGSSIKVVLKMVNGDLVYESNSALRNALKVVALFSTSLVQIAGRKSENQTNQKSYVGWNWRKEGRETLLLDIVSLLECKKLRKAWGDTIPEEDFLTLFSRCAFHLLEYPSTTKDKAARDLSIQILILCVTRYQLDHVITTPLLHLLMKYEHIPSTITHWMDVIYNKHDARQFLTQFLEAVSQKHPPRKAPQKTEPV